MTVASEFKILGFKVKDKVTGYEGFVESLAFDLYGCVHAAVRPMVEKTKDGKFPEGHYFDTKRLTVIGKSPVMPVPTFEAPIGGIERPALA